MTQRTLASIMPTDVARLMLQHMDLQKHTLATISLTHMAGATGQGQVGMCEATQCILPFVLPTRVAGAAPRAVLQVGDTHQLVLVTVLPTGVVAERPQAT